MIKYKAKNSLEVSWFAGVKTFMRMEHVVTTDDIDFAVVGIPYDTCASFRVGTRLGPAAIRDASALAAKPFNGPLNVGIFDWCPCGLRRSGVCARLYRGVLSSSQRECCPSLRRGLCRWPWAATTASPCPSCGPAPR